MVPDIDVLKDRITGCLIGTAVGDSIGLPYEGLSPQRATRIFGGGDLRHRFVLGHGMASDDTEHATMVAQALLASHGDPDRFTRSLSWRLRGWLLGAPAGVGLATLRSIVRLWLGWSPARSGVHSAGNGPAMRAPIIGACCMDDRRLVELIRASTRMTHTDPRAEQGAMLIALAARHGVLHGPVQDRTALIEELRSHVADLESLAAVDLIAGCLDRGHDASEFARELGLDRGVSGYISHTVPVVLFCRLRYSEDFRAAMQEIIRLGGDTDTTGAILGGLMGASLGESAAPDDWVKGISEWPRSASYLRRLGLNLARSAAGDTSVATVPLPWIGIPFRNPVFTVLVLLHGFRRMFPPY